MSERGKNGWPENFYSPEELAEFAGIGRKFTPEEIQSYQKKWAELIEEIKNNLTLPAESPGAGRLAERWQELLEEGFSGHEKLLERISQAYSEGAIPEEYSMIGPAVQAFIKKVQGNINRK
ncbi:MAG: TipAS antibiotic-recognition domain-containing protein [Candidatus Saccharicenans sp.]|nr:TipAS antibiotic-recognition domain-containing protein [Candidatus Saccharicenans sp.]